MADPKSRLLRIGDWALDVPVPNPGLQEWLNGPQAKAQLEAVAQEIYRAYRNYLPASRGPKPPGSGKRNLKKGAFAGVGQRQYKGQTKRYYAWVGNRALSYRPAKGKPYPRYIEYGKANADGTRTGGGYHLRNAAAMVARRRGLDDVAMSLLGGMSGAGTAPFQARPAKKLNDAELAKLRELAGGGAAAAERSARNRRRDAAARARAERSRANMGEQQRRQQRNQTPGTSQPAKNPRPPARNRKPNPFYDDPRSDD